MTLLEDAHWYCITPTEFELAEQYRRAYYAKPQEFCNRINALSSSALVICSEDLETIARTLEAAHTPIAKNNDKLAGPLFRFIAGLSRISLNFVRWSYDDLDALLSGPNVAGCSHPFGRPGEDKPSDEQYRHSMSEITQAIFQRGSDIRKKGDILNAHWDYTTIHLCAHLLNKAQRDGVRSVDTIARYIVDDYFPFLSSSDRDRLYEGDDPLTGIDPSPILEQDISCKSLVERDLGRLFVPEFNLTFDEFSTPEGRNKILRRIVRTKQHQYRTTKEIVDEIIALYCIFRIPAYASKKINERVQPKACYLATPARLAAAFTVFEDYVLDEKEDDDWHLPPLVSLFCPFLRDSLAKFEEYVVVMGGLFREVNKQGITTDSEFEEFCYAHVSTTSKPSSLNFTENLKRIRRDTYRVASDWNFFNVDTMVQRLIHDGVEHLFENRKPALTQWVKGKLNRMKTNTARGEPSGLLTPPEVYSYLIGKCETRIERLVDTTPKGQSNKELVAARFIRHCLGWDKRYVEQMITRFLSA